MTAEAEQAAAAAAALDLGMQLSAQYHDAAGQSPGVGLQVALPSVSDSQGRPVIGEGFDVPAAAPALRPTQAPRLVPNYAAEVVGGLGHHAATPGGQAGLDGVSWPSSSRNTSSIAYVGRGSKSVRPARVKAARARIRRSLRGR